MSKTYKLGRGINSGGLTEELMDVDKFDSNKFVFLQI